MNWACFTQKHGTPWCSLSSLPFAEGCLCSALFYFTFKTSIESGDSKKSLKSKSQIRGMVERIGVCVGLYLTHWFSETLPCSACSDISLLGSNLFWNTEFKWGKPEPLLTGNASWRPCEPGETILGPKKYSRRHSNWKTISKTKPGSDPALWSSSCCSSTLRLIRGL